MHHLLPAAVTFCLLGGTAVGSPVIVTDIPPVHALVAQVMGDLGTPVLLLDQGADAHDYQLRPSQAKALAEADIIFWIGPELTPWLDRALPIADGATSVPLLHLPGTFRRSFGDDAEHRHHTDVAVAEPGEDGHDHSETGLDPHAWLDPVNAAQWLGRIADELSLRDPGNSVTYRANASLAQASIEALAADLQEQLTKAQAQPLVVAHDSLGYFADHFGLTVAGTVADGDAADPGAAHLSEIRALLETGAVACIFPEALGNTQRIATLAEGTTTRIGNPLDPEARTLVPGPALYTALLTGLGTAIADCVAER